MKNIFGIILLAFSAFATANNVVVNGTRFIYPSNEKEITIQLNNNAPHPSLVQTWIDEGDPDKSPDEISSPFVVTPPVSKIEARSGQTLRIKALNMANVTKDRESMWHLNILEIPPTAVSSQVESKNVLKLAIRSRFKFIYRPSNLSGRDDAANKLVLKAAGNKLNVENPTPFFITVDKVTKGNKRLNSDVFMLSPKSSIVVPLNTRIGSGEKLTISDINDYGTGVEHILTTK